VSNLAAPKNIRRNFYMFDKLVESTSTGAELGPRRRIFAVTLVVVTTLFATAVVASIYAADFDLGTSNFDIAELLTPVVETEPQPEPERQQRQNTQPSTSDRPSRVMNILRIDELPSDIPPVSTERSQYRSRPEGVFDVGNRPETDGRPSAPGDIGPVGPDGPGSSNSSFNPESNVANSEPPPPVKAPERKPSPQSLGVINGRASSLPHPPYPPTAKAVGAAGPVNVQVMIDEDGTVVSAKAISGHLLLRKAAEDAAKRAKFTTTYLSKVPVKVTGIITYNFVK
jgi:periplasmic protein TonB